MPATPPEWLGSYILGEPLGSGMQGAVYRARHSVLDRAVAIKILGTAEDSSVARFVREMKLLATLDHPNIVRVLDGGTQDETYYMVLELVEGESLGSALQEPASFSLDRAGQLALDICRGLSFIHQAGVIHRDLKPSNILLDRKTGRAKIADFGLARSQRSTLVTAEGVALGTPLFFSPEVFAGGPSTRQSDLWALGCVLYRLFTGHQHLPMPGPKSWSRILTEEPIVPPLVRKPGLDPALSDLLMSLLDRNPQTRLSDANAVVSALEKLFGGGTAGHLQEPDASPRRPLLGASLLILGALAIIVPLRRTGEQSRPSPPAAVSPSEVPVPVPTGTGLFLTWRAAARWEKELDGSGGRPVVQRLQQEAALPLGDRPGTWSYWIQLGRWLDGPGGPPPRAPSAKQGPMDPLDERLVLTRMAKVLLPDQTGAAWRRALANNLAASLLCVEHFPDDARSWLILGRAMELDHYPTGAHRCYVRAVSSLDKVRFENWPAWMWEALTRAYVSTGADLAQSWTATYRAQGKPANAWIGLLAAMEKDQSDVDQLRRMLDKMGDPDVAVDVFLTGAKLNQRVERWDWAGASYLSAMAAFPEASVLTTRAHRHFLEAGNVSMVREIERSRSVPKENRWIRQYALEGTVPPPAGETDTDAQLEALRIRVLLEASRFDEAAKALSPLEDGREVSESILLDLVGCGRASPELLDRCRVLLGERSPFDQIWQRAAGAFAGPASGRYFEAWFAEACSKLDVHAWEPLVHALWLSRSGRHAASLEALRAMIARPDAGVLLPLVLEIAVRSSCALGKEGRPWALGIPPAQVLPQGIERRNSGPRPFLISALGHLSRGELSNALGPLDRVFERAPDDVCAMAARAVLYAHLKPDGWKSVLSGQVVAARAQRLDCWLVREMLRLGRSER